MVKAGRHDPNNTTWSKDKGRLGFKLLEKMGWKEGKGLGVKEDGMTEHVRVKVKDDATGIGTGLDVSSWRGNTVNFEQTLARLNAAPKKKQRCVRAGSVTSVSSNDANTETHNIFIPRSPRLKAAPLVASRRMYNRKLVVAKTEFKHCEVSRSKLVGKAPTATAKDLEKAKEKPRKKVVDQLTEMQTTAGESVSDYFAQLAAKAGDVVSTSTHTTFASFNSGKLRKLAPSPASNPASPPIRPRKEKKRQREPEPEPEPEPKKAKKEKKEKKEKKARKEEEVGEVVPEKKEKKEKKDKKEKRAKKSKE